MFIYSDWDRFCSELKKLDIHSITAADLLREPRERFMILKHDVEISPKKALKLAKIEHLYGHRGSYYLQVDLLKSKKNIEIFKEIQSLGHEVSYHHDVMDRSAGDIDKAIRIFKEDLDLFERNGFNIKTVCQHGNPAIRRVGYASNRDFFRSKKGKW